MAHSTINNADIDLSLARRIVGDISEYEKPALTIETIIKTVSDFY